MQKSLLTALLGAVLVVPLVVPIAAHAESSYVGINAGQSKYSDLPLGISDKSATVVGLTYGVNINPNFDIEAGYLYHGEASTLYVPTTTTVKLDTQSVYLAAVGKLPVNEAFTVYAKGGVSVNYSKATTSDSSGSISDTNTKAGVMVGLGASYQFNKEFSGIVEYNYFDKPSEGDFKLSHWIVGGRYHF